MSIEFAGNEPQSRHDFDGNDAPTSLTVLMRENAALKRDLEIANDTISRLQQELQEELNNKGPHHGHL